MDPRFVYALCGLVLLLCLLVLALLFRSGPSGAGGSSLNLLAFWTWFTGYRTEILGTLLLASDQALTLGFISEAANAKIDKTLYALIAFTLHAAIKRGEEAAKTATETADVVLQTMPVGPRSPVTPKTPLT